MPLAETGAPGGPTSQLIEPKFVTEGSEGRLVRVKPRKAAAGRPGVEDDRPGALAAAVVIARGVRQAEGEGSDPLVQPVLASVAEESCLHPGVGLVLPVLLSGGFLLPWSGNPRFLMKR